jgi:hypothetical protein
VHQGAHVVDIDQSGRVTNSDALNALAQHHRQASHLQAGLAQEPPPQPIVGIVIPVWVWGCGGNPLRRSWRQVISKPNGMVTTCAA